MPGCSKPDTPFSGCLQLYTISHNLTFATFAKEDSRMRYAVRHLMPLGLLCLIVAIAIGAHANPNDYPEYANIKIAQNILIEFIDAEDVKQRLDSGALQMLIDVRNRDSFQSTHLPGAVSIPLRTLEERVKDISRDTPVVLY
jgi:hypothetical protein